MAKTTRTLSIALLVADTPVPQVVEKRGAYYKIYSEWLNNSLASIPRHAWQDDYKLSIKPFDVVKDRKYPDDGMLRDGLFDAIMITGSSASAYMDIPWTNQLVDFVKHVAQEHPLVRIIGICYGHQIVARALGGKVELSKKGWELGSYECAMTEEGRDLLGYGDEDEARTMKIHQVHRDIVTVLPDQCINLASTEKTEYQAFARRFPTDAPPLPSIAGTSAYMAFDISDFQADSSGPLPARSAQILTLQGHPEFDEEIVETIVKARSETVSAFQLGKVCPLTDADLYALPQGVIDGATAEEGMRRAGVAHDGIRLGRNFLAMLGLEPAKTDVDGGIM